MFNPNRDQPLAMCLAALAGFTDAVGYLWLGGIFISFMTGNSTRLGTELGGPDWSQAIVPVAVLTMFVGGVILATMLRRRLRRGRTSAMGMVTLLLLASSVLQAAGHTTLAIGAATLAMGAENTVFDHDGEVSIGLTYMTGTLVKMAQHMAAALLGGPAFGWVPNFLRWFSMLGGAVIGSLVYRRYGLDALWLATALAAMLTVFTVVRPNT